jgi:hypothetical protein
MLIEFNYKLSQLYYVRAAMVAVPSLLPDSHDVPWVEALIAACKTVRSNYVTTSGALTLAQGARATAHEKLHDACVSAHASMKSCYRKDATCLNALDNVPVQDQSLAETLERGQTLNHCWASLPNPPGWLTPFKVGPLDKTAFDALVSGLESAHKTVTDADQPFQLAEGAFRKQKDVMGDFVNAALQQGRAQFAEGTPERNVLDAIPTAPATQPPGKAQVSLAESPAAGAAHLAFAADHATSFEVWQKGPADAEFKQVADVILPGEYTASGLPAGHHQFKLVPLNSRGEGPASDVVTIAVAAAAAA